MSKELKMVGTNFMELNEATMTQIVQEWMDKNFVKDVKVLSVVKTTSHFRVTLEEWENK